jgi:hypothetical protein
MGFPGGEEAHRSRSAGIASAAVPRPVLTVDDIDEMRSVMSMAGEAEPWGIPDSLNLNRRRFEFS